MTSEHVEKVRFSGAGFGIVADAMGHVDAQPILFLHGAGQTRQSWGKAVREAARRGYRAVTVDLRGHGESGWAPDEDYAIT